MRGDCMCKHCPYFDGFGCTRSSIADDNDEKCICDADEGEVMWNERVNQKYEDAEPLF